MPRAQSTLTSADQGACITTPFVFTFYWQTRTRINIASSVIEAVALVAAAVLAYKLRSDFGWRVWKRLGADRRVARAHAIRLAFSTVVQLSLFFSVRRRSRRLG